MRETVPRRTIKKHELSADEVEKIVVAARTMKRTRQEIGLVFGVSSQLVTKLATTAKKDPTFLSTLKKKEDKRREKLRLVVTKSLSLLQSKEGLLRARDVVAQVEAEAGVRVSDGYVRSVLRYDLGARYKRIKKIPYLGNSDRCLLLRQHYARFMLA